MKKLAKLSAVFVAIFMLFSFVACSSSDDDDDDNGGSSSIVSVWSYTEKDGSYSYKITFTFYANNTYSVADNEEGTWEKGTYSGDTTKAGTTITLTPTWYDDKDEEYEPYKQQKTTLIFSQASVMLRSGGARNIQARLSDTHTKRGDSMAYQINADSCVNCGACESECPSGAISEANDKRQINADSCVSCGACSAACPAGAITEA